MLFKRLNLGSVGSKAKSGELNSPWKRLSCVSRAKCCPNGPAAHRSDAKAKVGRQQWLACQRVSLACAERATVASICGVTQERHRLCCRLWSCSTCPVQLRLMQDTIVADRQKPAAVAAPATS